MTSQQDGTGAPKERPSIVVPAAARRDGAAPDVESDPALDDRTGTDWSDEGGATTTGPATAGPRSSSEGIEDEDRAGRRSPAEPDDDPAGAPITLDPPD